MEQHETPIGRALAKCGGQYQGNAQTIEATKATKGFIYFIEVPQEGPIKIGWALDVEKRLTALQCGCPWPLRLLYFWPGTLADEAAIHRRLKEDHVRGEWFNPTKRVYGEMYGRPKSD